MKDKILVELEKKYTGHASKKYLESLAERLAENVNEEKDIEGAISELEKSPIRIADLQVEGDRRVSELQKKLDQKEATLKKEEDKVMPVEPEKKDDLRTEILTLKGELESLKTSASKRDARATLMERIKDKNIPDALLEDIEVNSLEEVDQVAEKLERRSKELRKSFGIETDPPKRSTGAPSVQQQIADDLRKFKPR